MAKDSCLARITAGVAVGGAVGGAVGAVYGTYEAVRHKHFGHGAMSFESIHYCTLLTSAVPEIQNMPPLQQLWSGFGRDRTSLNKLSLEVPGLMKIRYVGQTTLGSAAIFGLFLGAGSLLRCGKSY
ncbi:hypothetical protein RJ639_044494 [Escallonia herrerae]|uniref:Uncharacterized protein n=1 Tax=Escallonia herrerae TaxID=1293975 RepID=A0AA88WDU9_9ASTE|nr:hypothetical protein RJ639_044494 [Escallonia herrerae]